MTLRDASWPLGAPNWVDLTVPDQERGKRFYGELFGWEFLGGGGPPAPYFLCRLDGRDVAGLGKAPEGTEGGTYFAVEDIESVVAAAETVGGKVVVPTTDVGNFGAFVIMADHAGGLFGLWRPNRMIGFGVADVHGSARWHEYRTPDVAAAQEFYGAVLGHTYEELPDGSLAFAVDGEVFGRVSHLADDTPAHWIPHFVVDDMAAGVAKVGELGGAVLETRAGTPFGRTATVTDDQGVPFKLCDRPPGRR